MRGRYPFDEWLNKLRDRQAAIKIHARLTRLRMGNEGNWKAVGEGVRELRIPHGKGYRVYYTWDGDAVVLLLVGGDKSTQTQDISTAKNYRRNYYA